MPATKEDEMKDRARLVAMREGVTPQYVRLIARGERRATSKLAKRVEAALCDFDQAIADFFSKSQPNNEGQ